MELPIGFVIDGSSCGSNHTHVAKLNASLCGLKPGSFNWFEKLRQGLEAQGFISSEVDSCLYMKYGMMVITYVDDCIIVGNSMNEIDAFIKSMKNGPEKFILTDKGDVNKF